MTEQHDEFHHCPACGQRTRHRVSRDRKLAPVLWCQRCFHVRILAEQSHDMPASRGGQQAA